MVFRDFQGDHPEAKSPVDTFLKLLRDLVPDNIVTAATELNMLGIIFVSVFFGVALSLLSTDEGCGHIIRGVESFNKVVIKMVWSQTMCNRCVLCQSTMLMHCCHGVLHTHKAHPLSPPVSSPKPSSALGSVDPCVNLLPKHTFLNVNGIVHRPMAVADWCTPPSFA